jgi:transposase-like protein
MTMSRLLRFLEHIGHDPACPHCQHPEPLLIASRDTWRCPRCRRQFSGLTGTPFFGTNLPYDTLQKAWDLLAGGATAMQLHAALFVQYRTAFYWHRRFHAPTAGE